MSHRVPAHITRNAGALVPAAVWFIDGKIRLPASPSAPRQSSPALCILRRPGAVSVSPVSGVAPLAPNTDILHGAKDFPIVLSRLRLVSAPHTHVFHKRSAAARPLDPAQPADVLRQTHGSKHLTDKDLRILDELVGRDLQVERGWALADAARRVVVRAVARAEPAIEVAGAVDRHAAEVRAHTDEHERLRLLHALVVSLRVAQLAQRDGLGLLNLFLRARTDENGFATPLDDHAVARLQAPDVDLERGERHHVSSGVERREELDDEQTRRRGAEEARATNHSVVERPVPRVSVPHARLVGDQALIVEVPERAKNEKARISYHEKKMKILHEGKGVEPERLMFCCIGEDSAGALHELGRLPACLSETSWLPQGAGG